MSGLPGHGWTGPLFWALLAHALPAAAPNDDDSEMPTDETGEATATEGAAARDLFRFSLTDLDLELDFSYESRRVRSEPSGRRQTTYTGRDQRYSQALTLRFDGDFLDPNVLEFQGTFGVGLLQEHFRESQEGFTRSDSDEGLLLEYDLSLSAFRNRPVSVSAYARQSRDRVPRRFLPSLLEERREAGASLLAITGNWTTELGFDWSDIDRSGNRQAEDNEHLQNQRFYLDTRGEIGEAQRVHLLFNHEREQSDYQGSNVDLDTNRDELRLEHELTFGPERRHRLDTFFRYNDERGDLARDELELSHRLTLKHTDEFQTVYRYDFYEYDQDAVDSSRHKFDFETLYRPSSQWRITTDLFGLRERVEDDLEIDEYGGSLDVSYRQPGTLGEFLANGALYASQARTQGDADEGVVRGEVHVLDSVRPQALRQLDVKPRTILAYDAARTRIFLPERDYRVIPVGRRTFVFRVLSGNIAENEPVYFDYDYIVPLGDRVDSHRADLDLEYAFRFGLTPYYRFGVRRENVDGSRGSARVRDNTEHHRLGLRYERPSWSVTGEAELFRDSNLPYDAYHLTARAAVWRSTAHSVDTTMQLSRYLFEADFDSRHVWWFNVDVTDRIRLDPYWSASVSGVYRYEDDSIDGETNAVDLEAGLLFARGQLEVELTAEYDLLSIAENRESGFGLWLNIRRNLADLLPSSRMTRR